MPSTVYKGDLAEVSFAPETGLQIRIGTNAASDCGLSIATTHGNGYTTLTFKLEVNTTLFQAQDDSDTPRRNALRYPKNMLVGSQLVWTTAGGIGADDIEEADLANTSNGGRVFTIIENDGVTMKITPEMFTPDIATVGPGNVLEILPYKTPPIDVSSALGTATESVKTDQFLGIANAITLPETKIDLKRFHVVGLGRDTSVQVPGKITNEGGSFEVAMHSARWLKYCLGQELIGPIQVALDSDLTPTLSNDTVAGQSQVVVSAAGGDVVVGTYLEIHDPGNQVPIVSDHEPDGGAWDGSLTPNSDNGFKFDTAAKNEIRRIIGISENDNTLYLDEPLSYAHASGLTCEIRKIGDADTNCVAISASGAITNPMTHLIYSRSTVPSFSLEVSQRQRDMDTDDTTVDGGVGDSKELTRLFRGCKVTDWSMTTDNDAALRLSVNFNAALCYTDTGRLEGTPITRYASHRMFEDTAATEAKRIESGIGKGTQKPFMFYNGGIHLAGQQVAQVFNFTLTGQNGIQSFHTINGHHQTTSPIADQVAFAGARNANLMVEGKTSYEMTMEIGVDDPLFYHKMRSGTEFSVNQEDSTSNQIRIEFEKNLSGGTAAGASEKMVLIIDDYYIIEAPLQIPEDKGIVKSMLKIMPKAVKVIARDSIMKY
jgi:hypothetical protein